MRVRETPRRKRSAMALVEATLVMSIALLILMGILEYGRFMMTKQLLENAAREGARYAIVNTQNVSTSAVQNYVDGYLFGQSMQLTNYDKTTSITINKVDPTTGTTTGAWTSAQFGDSIAVSISGTYQPVLPVFLFMPSPVSIAGTCVMKSEAN
jgi:Flp pilus assembly protein TadG